MSKLNTNQKEWLDMLFEGKNKDYGAYVLRQENEKTTLKAFFAALLFVGSMFGIFMFLSSFNHFNGNIDDNEINKNTPLIFTKIDLPPIEKKETFKPKEPKINPPVEKKVQPPITNETLKKPVVVTEQEASNVEIKMPDKKDTSDTSINPTGSDNVDKSNTTTINLPIGNGTDKDDNGNKGKGSDVILGPNSVDKNPSFPGGIERFLRIVGNRFTTPEIDEVKTIRIYVFFVVEKDGTISNIKVSNNPGYGLDKEAIKVLKSIKDKWQPGIFKGEPVRTSFSLPIVVNTL